MLTILSNHKTKCLDGEKILSSFSDTISKERKQSLLFFVKNLSISFKNISLLQLALTHRSCSNTSDPSHKNNERLEFLGDSVLGLTVAEQLFELLSNKPEGDLAKIKAIVVSEDTLSKIALKFDFPKMLILGKGEEQSGGRFKKAILADSVEAVIGAYFIDAGFEKAKKFVLSFINSEIELVLEHKHKRDYKTELQELQQHKTKHCPIYFLEKETGPDHDKTFWISVKIENKKYGPASGKTKKEAEQEVAKQVYELLSSKQE